MPSEFHILSILFHPVILSNRFANYFARRIAFMFFLYASTPGWP
jgi:hypothetical protein